MAKVNTVNRTPYLWPSNAYQDSPQFVFFFLPRTFHSLGDVLSRIHRARRHLICSSHGNLALSVFPPWHPPFHHDVSTHTALENTLPYVHPGATVVIVGSGSGYLAAVLHHLVSPMHSSDNPNLPQGKVIGIDHIPDVAERSKYNLENDGLGAGLTVRSN